MSVTTSSFFGLLGPLLKEELEVGMDVLLKLANRLGTEGVRYDLAFAGVFSSITSVEESSGNGYKGIIVLPVIISIDQDN